MTGPDPEAPARPLRFAEAVAGLLSAGLVVLALVMVGAKVLAPSLLGGVGLARAQGPAWWRLLLILLVGALGETARLLRTRFPFPARWALGAGTLVVAVAALWVTFWN